MPFLEFDWPLLEDPWEASSLGHGVGPDAKIFKKETWTETIQHYQAKILKYESMGPDWLLGARAAQTTPPLSSNMLIESHRFHLRASLMVSEVTATSGAVPLCYLAAISRTMVGLGLPNPQVLITAVQNPPWDTTSKASQTKHSRSRVRKDSRSCAFVLAYWRHTTTLTFEMSHSNEVTKTSRLLNPQRSQQLQIALVGRYGAASHV